MRPSRTTAGIVGTIIAALLLRTAIVRAAPESDLARQLSPKHPAVLTATAMREVGLAAAAGKAPPSATLDRIQQLARTSPLAPEPFLIAGAMAEKRGALNEAERLYLDAQRLQPRSVAARYLLTDLYLRTGKSAAGIHELATLTELIPASSTQLVSILAALAHSRGAAAQLRGLFGSNPGLEQPVLSTLANDPANADLILSLAGPTRVEEPTWQEKLLEGMIAKGDYARAHAVWARLSGLSSASPGLFNRTFHTSAASPPFNWSLVSGQAGEAELENGNLRILYYGRQNAVLARQILLLSPGDYRLSVPIESASGSPSALAWSVMCLPGKKQLLRLSLSGAANGQSLASDFNIPKAGCQAQQIGLEGAVEESPETTDLRIGPLGLQRVSK